MVLQRMLEKLITILIWGKEPNQKKWHVHTELESNNAERWDFLTFLLSSCCIMKLKPM